MEDTKATSEYQKPMEILLYNILVSERIVF